MEGGGRGRGVGVVRAVARVVLAASAEWEVSAVSVVGEIGC
eukprot:COSAG05_NODE_22152_length_267_cov_0.000000_1_plen_40_part_01